MDSEMKIKLQLGLYFDQTRCTGCYACIVACKDWHNIPAGPASWLRVHSIEKGIYPNPYLGFFVVLCYQCIDPPCITVCHENAIFKREDDGIVVVDRKRCLGRDVCGGKCSDICPYNVPQYDAEDNPKMQKCDFCLERWSEGKKPICVCSCPTRALDAGPLMELQVKYGDGKKGEGFNYSERCKPSIIIHPKLYLAT
jgi:anaerobic dimethyl sulfoxide reductase subunit B